MADANRVPIGDVRADPKQPRTYFSETALNSLAISIAKVGQRTPISVRRRPGNARPPFDIVDGERRWRACKLAGLKTIRICIEEVDLEEHADMHRLSVVSNFMREGHTHVEISDAISYQVEAAVEAGESHGQAVISLAADIGKSGVWVYSYLKLQNLCAMLKARMHPDTPDDKRLRFAEAQVLCGLPAAKQQEIYRQLLKVKLQGRLTLAQRLAEEVTGTSQMGRPRDDKIKVDRFVSRLTADIERTMSFKQSAFRDALLEMDPTERKDFRASVAMLLGAIDRVGEKARG